MPRKWGFFIAFFGIAWVGCSADNNPSESGSNGGSATVTISNLHNRGMVQTGFILGTSSGVSQVGVQYDGGMSQVATGTTSWSAELPNGASTWKKGTTHSISVGSVSGTSFTPLQTIFVIKGDNLDFIGGGYPSLAIGAYEYSNGSAGDGAVYIFYGSEKGISSQTVSTPTLKGAASSGEYFGYSIAVGDVNGDGYADLIVGAPNYNNGSAGDGAVFIFYGSGNGITSETVGTPTILGVASSVENFGSALALGDMNGDGYADLAVGASLYNNGSAGDGGVYLFSGSSKGISSQTASTPTLLGVASSGENFGNALALGDINGDGYADLAVGAIHFNNGSAGDGGVYIFPGSSSGISSQTASTPTISGKASSAEKLGSSLALGDINWDGYADLVVGASNDNNGSAGDGGVYIYPGSLGGISSQTAGTPTISGKASSGEGLGQSVAVGDVNGDGYTDLVVGAPSFNNGSAGDGAVYIYLGSSTGISSQTASAPTVSGEASSGEGIGSILGLADVNGDGYADLVAGAPNYNNGSAGDGGAYVYSGSANGVASCTAGTPTILGQASSGEGLGDGI